MSCRKCFWMLFGLWLAAATPAWAAVVELREARAAVTVDGDSELTAVTLPYHWDRRNDARPGEATFEVYFDMPGEPAEPHAVFFARIGNAYEVWLNGTLLSRSGDLKRPNSDDYAKGPRMVVVPPQLLQKNNLFRINLRADGGRRGGLSVPVVGPEDEVREIYQQSYRVRVAGSLVVTVVSLVVGALALLLWLTQSDRSGPQRLRRSGIYLAAGLAELAWAIRVGDTLIDNPPLPWPWWGIVVSVAYAGWITCIATFCHHVAGWHAGRYGRLASRSLVVFFASGAICATWALLAGASIVWTAWLGLASLFFLIYGCFYAVRAFQSRQPERVVVAIATLCTVLAGARDWLFIRSGVAAGGDFYGDAAWMRFMSLLYAVALGYIVVSRFRTASAQARDLMANLAQRVAQKEQELEQTYGKLEQLAREQERTSERTRILRDMHDGVGSHISAAIRQLQSGKASQAELLQTLRDSLDQLKLTIDAMHLPPGDLTALLANLRYRLEPRFASSDIRLKWDVDLLEPVSGLDAGAMRQLQFLVFEALSNVLQHSRAGTLTIEARALPGGAQLRIIDDGCGFDVQAPQRKGLASMHERARAVGARLTVTSQPGRTVVELIFG